VRLLATAPGRDALGLWRQGGDGLGVATRSGLTYLRLVGHVVFQLKWHKVEGR